MTDINQLLAALASGNQTIQAQNPYTGLQNTAGQIGQLTTQSANKDNWKQAILASAISGLFGGAMGQLGSNYQANQSNQYQDLMGSLLSGQDVGKPEGISDALFNQAQAASKTYQLQEKISEQNEMDKLKLLMQGKAVETAMSNPKIANQVVAKLFGVETNPAKPIVAEGNTAERGSEGGLLDQMNAEYQKLVDDGVPTTQAATMARDDYGARQKQLGDMYKEIDEVTTQTNNLRSLYENLSKDVDMAGATGKGGNIRQFGSEVLAEFGNKNQIPKAAAGESLKSLSADIVRTARQVGSGPMSDKDVQLYLSSGPTLTNTPEGNRQILERFKQAVTLQDKYLEFMYEKQNTGVPIAKAKKEWNDLRKTNPYLVKEGNTYIPNSFWFDGGESQSVAINSPEKTTSNPVVNTQAPTETRLGKDGKTYNVRRLPNGKTEILGIAQ